MRKTGLVAAIAILIAFSGRPQGVFEFSNAYALTRVGSVDGPLAGSAIWAQMLAGASAAALAPVGMPLPHLDKAGAGTGLVNDGLITLPAIPPGQTAYVEMLAWDSTRWGAVLSAVPTDQLGTTDVVPVVLGGLIGLPPLPHFTQSAIVPVPEPSPFGVAVMGALCALVFCAGRKRLERRPPGGVTRRREE
jgi:hypothetical protein